jgi:hypothetical protein
MRLSGDGTPKVLEINLIPSLIEGYGTFGKSLQLNKNIGYDEMIARIVSLAFDRKTQTLELSTR